MNRVLVQSGALRFTVEGREPVVATKGVMVQVPYRTFCQIENAGTEPALRFEVNVARARRLCPMDETPVPLPGFEYVPTRVAACGGLPAPAPAAGEPAAPAAAAVAPGSALSGAVTLSTGYPDRAFVRVQFDALTWRPTEGNTLGVETAVVEGDPSKPGYYLTINHFPAGVMRRPHYHPDERYIVVLRGTWYTDEGEVFRPNQTVPLKPGDFMRHPRNGPHYDGALDEDTWVAIGGHGPTTATVIDGGELFGRSRQGP